MVTIVVSVKKKQTEVSVSETKNPLPWELNCALSSELAGL